MQGQDHQEIIFITTNKSKTYSFPLFIKVSKSHETYIEMKQKKKKKEKENREWNCAEIEGEIKTVVFFPKLRDIKNRNNFCHKYFFNYLLSIKFRSLKILTRSEFRKSYAPPFRTPGISQKHFSSNISGSFYTVNNAKVKRKKKWWNFSFPRALALDPNLQRSSRVFLNSLESYYIACSL